MKTEKNRLRNLRKAAQAGERNRNRRQAWSMRARQRGERLAHQAVASGFATLGATSGLTITARATVALVRWFQMFSKAAA